MRISRICFIVLIVLATLTQTLFAQDIDFVDMSLEELLELNIKVFIASSKPETIFDTPSTVSVIDRQLIEKYNFSSISEALNIISGFFVTRTYLKRNLPTSRGVLQDHYANKVLIMINNIPSWQAVTGEGCIDRININDVERIEVLKGTASVLYGTNAYSGAVNIVLKTPMESQSEIHLTIGDNAKFGAGGNYTYSKDDFSVFVSGNSTDDNGRDIVFVDENNEHSHLREYLRGSNFTLNLKNKNHSVFFNGFTVHESYFGVVPQIKKGAGNDHLITGYLLNYTFSKNFGENIHFNYGINYDWNHRDLSRSFDDNTRAKILGYRLTNFARTNFVIKDFRLEIGADYDYRKSVEYKNYDVSQDTLIADNNMGDKDIYEFSVLGQIGFHKKLIKLLLGMRYTNNELFGNNLSSRGTLVFNLNKKNSLKLIFGQSYRAPSLFELYFITPSFTVFGSNNLKPEKSKSMELAYLTSFNKFFIQALGYHATYDNKIFRTKKDVVLPDGTIKEDANVYANGKSFGTNGLEIEIQYKNPKFINGFLNYNFIDGDNGDEIDNNGHYNFKYIPKHSISAGLTKDIHNFSLAGVINYCSQTEGSQAKIEAQSVVDISLSYHHKIGSIPLKHTISAKNVFDKFTLTPEYVRRNMNEIPLGNYQRISYKLYMEF